MTTEKKSNLAVISTLVGWSFTILALVWQVAVKDANYSMRLATIETELINLDSRLDTAEEFRLTLATDLAEIKTDLLWIRALLEEMNDSR